MKNRYFLLLLMIVYSLTGYSQRTVNVCGGSATILNQQHSFSIGEMVCVHTVQSNNRFYTQGILQPQYIVQLAGTNDNSSILGNEILLAVYPNPGSGYIRIQLQTPQSVIKNVQLVDFAGRYISFEEKQRDLDGSWLELDFSRHASGNYMLLIDVNDEHGNKHRYSYTISKL